MRPLIDTTTIKVSKTVKARLEKDKKYFEKLIGGGKWSLNDTLIEYHKILDMIAEQEKEKRKVKK